MEKKPKWHKEWDRIYKKMLSDECVSVGGNSLTFNEYAKGFIDDLIEEARTKEMRRLFDEHNLIALGIEKSKDTLYKREVKKLIRIFKKREKEAQKYLKALSTKDI